MKDIFCPYCDVGIDICNDDGNGSEEGVPYEEECPECEKLFVFYTSISFDYEAQKADCLNGGEHDYKNITLAPVEFETLECTMCGHRQQMRLKEGCVWPPKEAGNESKPD